MKATLILLTTALAAALSAHADDGYLANDAARIEQNAYESQYREQELQIQRQNANTLRQIQQDIQWNNTVNQGGRGGYGYYPGATVYPAWPQYYDGTE